MFLARALRAPQRVKLYQYAICPFCNKAKAAFDLLKVPYEQIEVPRGAARFTAVLFSVRVSACWCCPVV